MEELGQVVWKGAPPIESEGVLKYLASIVWDHSISEEERIHQLMCIIKPFLLNIEDRKKKG